MVMPKLTFDLIPKAYSNLLSFSTSISLILCQIVFKTWFIYLIKDKGDQKGALSAWYRKKQ